MIFSGAVHFTVASNDCAIRNFDMEKFQLSKHFCFPWPVNVSLFKIDKWEILFVFVQKLYFHFLVNSERVVLF